MPGTAHEHDFVRHDVAVISPWTRHPYVRSYVVERERTMARLMRATVVLAGLAVSVVACGETPGTRAVTGGLLGAGGGAAVGAATGGNAGTGALIGGGVGAIGGAVTAPRR